MANSRILIDPATFDPWKIQRVNHELTNHPLLQIDSLIELGRRLQERRLVRTHSGDATAGTSFVDAPQECPNPKSAEETLGAIEQANAWMSLLNVQADPIYRRLIDEILDEVRPMIESKDPGLSYRGGWIFVTSPHAITPFHMDHEHNFILQVRGNKRLYVWDPFDREILSEQALERFHDNHSRELVRWNENFRKRASVFDLSPGQGGYMPSTAPHMVENGDEPSVTISFTYYTDSTRRRELLYRGNARLRGMGFSPKPIASFNRGDNLKHSLLSSYFGIHSRLRRMLGKSVRDNCVRYAPT
jgi:Cupin-like domain